MWNMYRGRNMLIVVAGHVVDIEFMDYIEHSRELEEQIIGEIVEKNETHEELRQCGYKGETFDEIINKLIECKKELTEIKHSRKI
jgi:hypothetical protein